MNVGKTDKIIRVLAGLAVLALAFTQLGGVATTAGIVATVIAVVLVVTGIFSFCPLYKLIGASTRKSTS